MKFADGLIFKRKGTLPEWVVGKLSVKVDEFTKFLTDNEKDGWVNLDIKKSKGGKYYVELDEWKPVEQPEQTDKGDLPF